MLRCAGWNKVRFWSCCAVPPVAHSDFGVAVMPLVRLSPVRFWRWHAFPAVAQSYFGVSVLSLLRFGVTRWHWNIARARTAAPTLPGVREIVLLVKGIV